MTKVVNLLTLGPIRGVQQDLEDLQAKGIVNLIQVNEPTVEQFQAKIKDISAQHHISAIMLTYSVLRKIDETVLQPLVPHLKIVAGGGAGYDNVDIDYLTKNKAYYANTPIAVSETTAVMLILQTIRNYTQATENLRKGEWVTGLPLTPNVQGLVVGIVGVYQYIPALEYNTETAAGMGMIGKLSAALGMKVVYHNRTRLPEEGINLPVSQRGQLIMSCLEEKGATYLEFDELLQQSRLITLHCPLTPATRHLLSDDQFAKMQDGVFIVNTARGPVIDEEALVRAMKSGKVARCGLDVYENEPKVHEYLASSNRTVLLPHYAAFIETIFKDVETESLNNIKAWLEKGVPNTPVNDPKRAS
ncbi:palmitoyltransferase pfa5 [Serendipita sp. 399]|nr:palmitoyltransferase pfa5 [Serendipita sp. 399]